MVPVLLQKVPNGSSISDGFMYDRGHVNFLQGRLRSEQSKTMFPLQKNFLRMPSYRPKATTV